MSIKEVRISGEVNGFHVTVCLDEEDLVTFNPETETIEGLNFDVGVLQHIVLQMRDEHSVLPLTRKNGSVADSAPNEAQGEAATWVCPEHKDASVFPNSFPGGKGLMCKRWIPAEGVDKPDWCSAQKPAFVNGQSRWYCKHREFYQAK